MTVRLDANADQTHNLPTFSTDSANSSRVILGKAAPHYRFEYATNKNTWRRVDLFVEWIYRLDDMSEDKRRIALILLDNVSSYNMKRFSSRASQSTS